MSTTGRRSPSSGKRRQSREMALQMLYQWDQAGSDPRQIFRAFDLHLYGSETSTRPRTRGSDESFAHARELVTGTVDRLAEIDAEIVNQAENWRLERMSAVDRNILRLAIYQLDAEPDVPRVVVIDESIELAKKFGAEQSGAFVNGVLDALSRSGASSPAGTGSVSRPPPGPDSDSGEGR